MAGRGDSSPDSWILISHDGKEEYPGEEGDEGNIDDDDDDTDDHCQLELIEVVPWLPPSATTSSTPLSEIVSAHALPLLPAKSLLRLRAVCRSWNHRITSPFFAHQQPHLSHAAVSGVFFRSPISPYAAVYASFSRRLHGLRNLTNPLYFLQEPSHVLSSSYGLVICHGQLSRRYYTVNPVTAEFAQIPLPISPHGDETELAIVFEEPLVFNFSGDYYLVCARVVSGVSLSFDVFFSREWKWRKSTVFYELKSEIVKGSGVGVIGAAYWRSKVGTVVKFDSEADTCQELGWPEGSVVGRRWEIGEHKQRLCGVYINGGVAGVYELVERDQWERKKKEAKVEGVAENAIPLPVQGDRELLFWEADDERIVARNIDSAAVRTADHFVPEGSAAFIPYIASLIHVSEW